MTHHVIIFNTCFPGQRGVVLRMGFPVPVGCYARTPRDCKRLRSHMCMYIYIYVDSIYIQPMNLSGLISRGYGPISIDTIFSGINIM
jgi:hypothetical protein